VRALEVENERLRRRLEEVHREFPTIHAVEGQRASGQVRGVNAMNEALWRLGALQHEPPTFEYFDPVLTERMHVSFKEVRLPHAGETHELVFEPTTRCLFVSQMSNSVLVRIPVGPGGLLLDDQDAWRVGPTDANGDGLSGLHNLSLSPSRPGHLWVSLQWSNTLLLVEAATMKIKQVMLVPTMLVRDDGTATLVGGPHCVRECPHTGELWAALKGSVACHPAEVPRLASATGARGLRLARERVCCNTAALRERMAKLERLGYNTPPPEGFAVWRVDPRRYDPTTESNGGTLYETRPSPPMVAIDEQGDCWVAQDQSETLLRIDRSIGDAEVATVQYEVPHPLHHCRLNARITGPAIAVAPDGGVWVSLLSAQGAVVRICPHSKRRVRYELPVPAWMTSCRFIHMVFHTADEVKWIFNGQLVTAFPREPSGEGGKLEGGFNFLFLISSNLVEDDAINALVCVGFSPQDGGWTHPMTIRVVPLTSQDCCCHRVTVIADGLPPEEHSVAISLLSSSKVFQMKLQWMLGMLDMLAEEDLSALPDAQRKELDSIPMSADVEHGVRRFRMLGNHQTKDKGTAGGSFKPTAASDERVAILIYSMRIAVAPGGDGKLRWLESSLAMLPKGSSGLNEAQKLYQNRISPRRTNPADIAPPPDANGGPPEDSPSKLTRALSAGAAKARRWAAAVTAAKAEGAK